MNIEEKYKDLIIKYLDDDLSEAELTELTEWLKADKANFKFFVETKDIWDSASLSGITPKETEKALTDFYRTVQKPSPSLGKGRKIIRYFLQAAAVILMAVLLNFLYQIITKSKPDIVDGTGSFTEVVVPLGHKAQITLPDGTRVWLNSNTNLRYPAAFDGEKRIVYLDGEAYLDVARNPQRPFFVETSGLILQVLGTSFNLKSYGSENHIETTLIEGSLKILPASSSSEKFRVVTLKPNEKATYIKDRSLLSVDELDVDQKEKDRPAKNRRVETTDLGISQIESIIAWKDNELIFRNETLEDMCLKMERWYGISIRIQDKALGKYRYSGKFVYNETINQVMDILSLTTPIQYTLDKNVLIIKEKPNN